ncbi:MAG: hypothetical protein WC741_04720 [Patescibacteria group bacterium]|jgi:hypothetical protein
MANQSNPSDAGTVNPQSRQDSRSPESQDPNELLREVNLRDYFTRVYNQTKDALAVVNKKIEDQNAKIDKQKEDFIEQGKIINDRIKDLNNKEIRILEALGVFFALFTFISTNVQIFSRVTDLSSAVIFSTSIFCMLILMLIIFTFLLNRRENSYILWHFLVFFTFLILGITSINWLLKQKFPLNHIENTTDFNNAVDKRINEKVIIDNILKASPTPFPTQVILPQ